MFLPTQLAQGQRWDGLGKPATAPLGSHRGEPSVDREPPSPWTGQRAKAVCPLGRPAGRHRGAVCSRFCAE